MCIHSALWAYSRDANKAGQARLTAVISASQALNAYHLGMSRIAVYSGTFDPITLGHEDVIGRAAALFDTLIVAVAVAHHKKTLFPLKERIELAQRSFQTLANVQIKVLDGLIVEFCRAHNAQAIVRGVRNTTDFDYESQMAAMNRKLQPEIDTVILLPTPTVQCISSTLVREISMLGGDISPMVNPDVLAALDRVHRPKLQA
jgi:pantetheine-phosphate adenylyltransferase